MIPAPLPIKNPLTRILMIGTKATYSFRFSRSVNSMLAKVCFLTFFFSLIGCLILIILSRKAKNLLDESIGRAIKFRDDYSQETKK